MLAKLRWDKLGPRDLLAPVPLLMLALPMAAWGDENGLGRPRFDGFSKLLGYELKAECCCCDKLGGLKGLCRAYGECEGGIEFGEGDCMDVAKFLGFFELLGLLNWPED